MLTQEAIVWWVFGELAGQWFFALCHVDTHKRWTHTPNGGITMPRTATKPSKSEQSDTAKFKDMIKATLREIVSEQQQGDNNNRPAEKGGPLTARAAAPTTKPAEKLKALPAAECGVREWKTNDKGKNYAVVKVSIPGFRPFYGGAFPE